MISSGFRTRSRITFVAGGFIVANNVLWKGHVALADRSDAETQAMAAFNDSVAGDSALEVVMLTVGEGLTIFRPRG